MAGLVAIPILSVFGYSNELYDFSIEPPKNWESIENLEGIFYQPVLVAFLPLDFQGTATTYLPNIEISFNKVRELEGLFIGNQYILKYYNELLLSDVPSAKVISSDIKKTSWGWILNKDVTFSELFDIGLTIQMHTEQYVFHFSDGEAYTVAYFASKDYYDEYYPEFKKSIETLEIRGIRVFSDSSNGANGGGCLIATATYGSELAPQVQQLREIRDNHLMQTSLGFTFLTGFNQFYYSFSPTIADWERHNPVFKEAVKLAITPLLTSLSILNYVEMNSEAEILGYGISVILLNIGIYFVVPALIIHTLRKKVSAL